MVIFYFIAKEIAWLIFNRRGVNLSYLGSSEKRQFPEGTVERRRVAKQESHSANNTPLPGLGSLLKIALYNIFILYFNMKIL